MSDTIRMYRVRVEEVLFQEYLDLTPEQYTALTERVGDPSVALTDADAAKINNAIDEIVGAEWECDWSGGEESKVTQLWRSEE